MYDIAENTSAIYFHISLLTIDEIIFHLGDTIDECKLSFKFLLILFDSNLKYYSHVCCFIFSVAGSSKSENCHCLIVQIAHYTFSHGN